MEATTNISELIDWIEEEQKKLDDRRRKIRSWEEAILEVHVAFIEDAMLSGNGRDTLAAAAKLLKTVKEQRLEQQMEKHNNESEKKEKRLRQMAGDVARRECKVRKLIRESKNEAMEIRNESGGVGFASRQATDSNRQKSKSEDTSSR